MLPRTLNFFGSIANSARKKRNNLLLYAVLWMVAGVLITAAIIASFGAALGVTAEKTILIWAWIRVQTALVFLYLIVTWHWNAYLSMDADVLPFSRFLRGLSSPIILLLYLMQCIASAATHCAAAVRQDRDTHRLIPNLLLSGLLVVVLVLLKALVWRRAVSVKIFALSLFTDVGATLSIAILKPNSAWLLLVLEIVRFICVATIFLYLFDTIQQRARETKPDSLGTCFSIAAGAFLYVQSSMFLISLKPLEIKSPFLEGFARWLF